MPDGSALAAFLLRSALHCLCHHQNFRLPLAASAPLEGLSLFIFRHFGSEEPLVQLYHIRQCVLFVPFSHSNPKSMKHRPNWHIVLVTELPLELQRGETLLRGGEQMDGRKPIQQRELTPVHYGVGCKALPVVALFAFEAFLVLLSIMMDASAFRADNALTYSVLFQLVLTGFLVRKLLGKINQVHLMSSFVETKITHDSAKLWHNTYFR